MLQFQEELNSIIEKGLKRRMLTVSSACGAYLNIGGRRLLNLCSNNYLGLSNDRRIRQAAISTINKFGLGAGASRLVSGNTTIHRCLEEKIAKFKKQESCLVYTSGYTANLGIISSLVSRNDVILSDRLNHASIIDGIILSRAQFLRYPHKDLDALEDLLNKNQKFKNKLIITDSIFSMDGHIACVPGLVRLAKRYDCLLMLDEAHATGVLGKDGRGALEHFGLEADERIIQMGTLSKAVGCLGGFVAGRKDLISYLINRSRPFIFTTALPAGLAAGAIKAIEIVEKGRDLRRQLWANADFLRSGLKEIGFDTFESSGTPIIPVVTREPKLTMEFSRRLFKAGIFVQGIRPPTVPEGSSRLRVTVMTTHTISDLRRALAEFKKIGRKLGVI